MPGTNKSCSLCRGALRACWAVTSTFILQLCLNLFFPQTQSIEVSQRWQLGVSNYHSWAGTKPYVCPWSSRFSGMCGGISVYLRMLRSLAFPFKLLFIVCPNSYLSLQGSCEIAVLAYKCDQQMILEKGFYLWGGSQVRSGKGSLLVGVAKGATRWIKQWQFFENEAWKDSGFLQFFLVLWTQAVTLKTTPELGIRAWK